MIRNRLLKNLRQRQKWIKGLPPEEKTEAFRLYDRDIPEYPFLIDLYQNFAVIFERGKEGAEESLRERHREDLQKALEDILQVSSAHLVFKERKRQRGLSQYQQSENAASPSLALALALEIKEGPARFHVDLVQYLDTGLFLDHRPLRKRVFRESKRKNVLNLFSYTGSLGLMAALGGAERTTNVDMSSTYQRWAQANYTLNGICPEDFPTRHQFIVENALHFLETESHQRPRQYDLIILDPPTFSNSKRMEGDFEIQRDHVELLGQALSLLLPGGTLYFSTNKRTFDLEKEVFNKKGWSVKNITGETIPPDFRDKKIHQCFQFTRE